VRYIDSSCYHRCLVVVSWDDNGGSSRESIRAIVATAAAVAAADTNRRAVETLQYCPTNSIQEQQLPCALLRIGEHIKVRLPMVKLTCSEEYEVMHHLEDKG